MGLFLFKLWNILAVDNLSKVAVAVNLVEWNGEFQLFIKAPTQPRLTFGICLSFLLTAGFPDIYLFLNILLVTNFSLSWKHELVPVKNFLLYHFTNLSYFPNKKKSFKYFILSAFFKFHWYTEWYNVQKFSLRTFYPV